MMLKPKFYRYFLGIRPPASLYPALQAWIEEAGQTMAVGLIHLTFCVVAETRERDRFIAGRVRRALNGQPFHSFPVNFSRIVLGPQGAFARTFGKQDEIQDFYRRLVHLLGAWGIEPKYRKSGFHPHSTLGHSACARGVLPVALQWFPSELLLIESEYGLTRHNPLARWPLLPTRQPLLPFDGRFSVSAGGNAIPSADHAPRSIA